MKWRNKVDWRRGMEGGGIKNIGAMEMEGGMEKKEKWRRDMEW